MHTLRLISLVLAITSLAACSSKPQYVYNTDDQYCYQTTKIYTKGDNVSSEGLTECTDKPRLEHVVKDSGVASDCRLSRPINSNRSDPKMGQTLLCKFTDTRGNTIWRPVNEAFAYPSFN